MAEKISNEVLLRELEPVAGQLLDAHLANSREWFPHELVPYSQGADFEAGYLWSPDDQPLSDVARSALFVNLLTEDNLPYYFNEIDRLFGADTAWGTWNRRWTAEEGRHAIVIRDYLTVTRSVDPVALERGRMAQMSKGEIPHPDYVIDGLVYVTLQELATRVAHRNTGKRLDEKGEAIMQVVANDENNHFLFYRGAASAALEIDPSGTVEAINRQISRFEMPGTGIPDFRRHALRIAVGGVYGVNEFLKNVAQPTLKHWKVNALEGLTPEAEAARTALNLTLEGLKVQASREQERREKLEAASLQASV